jgi:hypothetical protein
MPRPQPPARWLCCTPRLWRGQARFRGTRRHSSRSRLLKAALPLLALAGLRLASAPTLAAETTVVACPAAATAVLDGLYRWHVAKQRDSGPIVLISQRDRFTPELYSQLVRALAMTPAAGGFVDFDVFSGTQVSTFGASVRRCQAAGADLEALVAVQVGLRGRPTEPPMLLRYTLVSSPAGSWRIADITYPANPPFRLSEFLSELLKGRRP